MYIFLSVFMLPKNAFTSILAYIYCKAYEDQMKGFALSTAVIGTGFMIGLSIAFLISRYLFRNTIMKKVEKH